MRRPLIERKDFNNFHWIRKTSSKRGHWKLWGGGNNFLLSCVFFKEEENECVRGKLVCYV